MVIYPLLSKTNNSDIKSATNGIDKTLGSSEEPESTVIPDPTFIL
jgi:hypothetical protein